MKPELVDAYKKAHYVVFLDPKLVLRIGEPSARLDALLRGATAAFRRAGTLAGAECDRFRGKGKFPRIGSACLKLILDTNVWLDWLLFNDPSVAAMRSQFEQGLIQIFIAEDCEAELERALGYSFQKKFLDKERQSACMSECRKISRKIAAGAAAVPSPQLPKCRDPDDQKFLEAALAVGADFLVTKDLALLALARAAEKRALPFRIVRPQALPSARASS